MKTITIEGLLSWAFNEELPKVGAGGGGPSGVAGSAWSMVSDMAALGTLIDASPNQWGVIAQYGEADAPHPDALVVGETVFGLDSAEIDVPEGWAPFPDWDDPRGLVAEAVAQALERWRLKPMASRCAHIRTRLVSHAVLKRRPDWQAEEPGVRMVMRGGKPAWFVVREGRDQFGRTYSIEQDGYNAKRGKPVKGAYRKYCLSRDISGDVMDRLDWQLWVSALEAVAEIVGPQLGDHRIEPLRLARAPWQARKAA